MTRSLSPSKLSDSGYPSYLDVLPRHGTLRCFDRPTYGTRMGMVARLMGQPFMPWQQYAADIMGEVDPDTGVLAYRELYITLMRQVGKTTFVIAAKAHRALDTKTPVRVQFAAQHGQAAIAKMVQHAEQIKRTPLGRMLAADTPTTSNGQHHVTWRNGSQEWPLSDKEASGHGDTIALGAITEAMAHRDDRYIQTMQPAMNTNPNAQLLAESTQGNAKSIYWNEQTQELRDRYAADPAELAAARIAFIDYSFGPDDDIGSPDVWRARIPSLGHTMRVEEVQHAWVNATTPKKIRAFKRGFGNIADLGAGDDTVFTDDAWENSGVDDDIAADRVLTLDVTNDRSWASVAWCGPNRAGLMQSEVIAHERSTHWLLPYVGEVLDRNPRMPRRVYVVAAGGMAAAMADAFERADIEMVILNRADYAAACADYYDGITDEDGATIVHRVAGQTPLSVAVGGAAWTKGNSPRIWDNLRSSTVISPLVAVSIGPWSYRIEADRKPVEDILQTIA